MTPARSRWLRWSPVRNQVRANDHAALLRVWSRRHRQLSSLRTQSACQLHAVLFEITPGGIPHIITANRAAAALGTHQPDGPSLWPGTIWLLSTYRPASHRCMLRTPRYPFTYIRNDHDGPDAARQPSPGQLLTLGPAAQPPWRCRPCVPQKRIFCIPRLQRSHYRPAANNRSDFLPGQWKRLCGDRR
jgi:hypothetical protein